MAMAAPVLQTRIETLESSIAIENYNLIQRMLQGLQSAICLYTPPRVHKCVTNNQERRALSATLKHANLLCLSVHTWQGGVGKRSNAACRRSATSGHHA